MHDHLYLLLFDCPTSSITELKKQPLSYFLCFLGVSSWQVLISASPFSKQLFNENGNNGFFF